MNCLPINTLAFQPQLCISTFQKHGFYNSIHKPQLSLHSIRNPKQITLIHPTPKLQTFFKIHSLSQKSDTPISNSLSPQEKKTIFLLEKLPALLVGSFILMQCLCQKPVFALTFPKSSVSDIFEENKDAQIDRSEEEELYVKILEKNPRNVDALKVLVYGLMRRGKTKDAVEYVERLIDIEFEEVEWRLLQAICYEMMGQLSTAKRLFKEILEERPLLLKALHGLAMVMHKNHEGQAVFQMLYKALEIACREKRVTEERNIKILIAQMHVVKGQLEDGLKKFQNLVDENPRDFRPYLCQGIVYSLLDKKKEAEERFETYRSLVPDEFPQRGFLDDVVLTAKNQGP